MIFYFTGTGNSLYAAQELLEDGERLVDMAAARNNGEFEYDIAKGERVGFVFPVYFYTVNDLVREFISKVTLNGAGYIYGVITCGGGIASAGAELSKLLEERGYKLCRVFKLLMPDNALFYYNLPPLNVLDEKLRQAEEPLKEIAEAVRAKKCRDTVKGHFEKVKLGVYHKMTKTKSFYVTDKCISCGLCAERCPDQAIEMQNGKPVWVKENCIHCAACICRCPVQAIEHGNSTIGRTRYVNPILR